MSTVGLTTALRFAMANDGHWHPQLFMRAQRLGLIDEQGNKTPRGHAALAAPRMTAEQYTALALIEGHGEAVVTYPRTYATFVRNGWVSYRRITPAGRTALNNVRAAMGSQDYKEGL